MKYTVQLFADSGNWATPAPDDVRHCNSKADVAWHVDNWADTVERLNDRQCVTALVWKGKYDDVTDLYPDYEITIGPRGGIRWGLA